MQSSCMNPQWERTSYPKTRCVAEIQGPYGPVSIPETVVQKIWLRQDFLHAELITSSGASLRVLSPGRWNLQEGPDFKEAVLEIGGRRVVGDVEVHFYPEDWQHHGHYLDENYDRVVLHVVVFGGDERERPLRTVSGRSFAELRLLEYLHFDLEEYAADAALRALPHADVCAWTAWLLSQSIDQRQRTLWVRAQSRWRQKCRFAQLRLDRHGWEAACHQYALEVLGYSRNRAPMSSLALEFPLERLRAALPTAAELFNRHPQRWKLTGLRPANHPRQRLEQYLQWVSRSPVWPKLLREWLGRTLVGIRPAGACATSVVRKTLHLAAMRRHLRQEIVCNQLSATRLDTLMVDAFLPLYAAFSGEYLFDYWFHWYVGDMPNGLTEFLRNCACLEAGHVGCNGWYQGALQCLHEI